MKRILVTVATLLCASPALATPSSVVERDDADDAEASSAPAVTRTVALWTHGITGAASLVGGVVYGIRGLQSSDASAYEDECHSGIAGGCDRFEATERERRVDQSIGGALLLYSMTSLSSLFFLGSTDATRLDASQDVPGSVVYGTSAALSLVTAGLFVNTLKLRGDLSETADACFEGNCSEMPNAESDVEGSLGWPLLVSAFNYVLSVSTTVWLASTTPKGVSLLPTLDPEYAGATLTGRF